MSNNDIGILSDKSDKSDKSDPIDDNIESFNMIKFQPKHKLYLDASIAALLAMVAMSRPMSTIIHDIYPASYTYLPTGDKIINSTGTIIKITIVAILYILIEKYLIPSI